MGIWGVSQQREVFSFTLSQPPSSIKSFLSVTLKKKKTERKKGRTEEQKKGRKEGRKERRKEKRKKERKRKKEGKKEKRETINLELPTEI